MCRDFPTSRSCMTTQLRLDLEKHEEWMQGNVKSGYNAMQHSGSKFPPVIVWRSQVRLPEGKDILGAEKNEVVQYAYSLSKFNVIEVSASDKALVEGALSGFQLRGKLRTYSYDCDLLSLNVHSGHDRTKRLDFYQGFFSQMNYEHVQLSASLLASLCATGWQEARWMLNIMTTARLSRTPPSSVKC